MKQNKDFLSFLLSYENFSCLGVISNTATLLELHCTKRRNNTWHLSELNTAFSKHNTICRLSNPASCFLTLSTDTTLFTSPCVPNREKQLVFSNAKRDLKKITTQIFSRRRSPGHRVSFDSKLTAKHRQDQFGFFLLKVHIFWFFPLSQVTVATSDLPVLLTRYVGVCLQDDKFIWVLWDCCLVSTDSRLKIQDLWLSSCRYYTILSAWAFTLKQKQKMEMFMQ